MKYRKRLFFLFWSLLFGLSVNSTAEICSPAAVDVNTLDIHIPCIGVQGQQYRVDLSYDTEASGPDALKWKYGGNIEVAACEWKTENCTTLTDGLDLTMSLCVWR